jgi:hypothetical protein
VGRFTPPHHRAWRRISWPPPGLASLGGYGWDGTEGMGGSVPFFRTTGLGRASLAWSGRRGRRGAAGKARRGVVSFATYSAGLGWAGFPQPHVIEARPGGLASARHGPHGKAPSARPAWSFSPSGLGSAWEAPRAWLGRSRHGLVLSQLRGKEDVAWLGSVRLGRDVWDGTVSTATTWRGEARQGPVGLEGAPWQGLFLTHRAGHLLVRLGLIGKARLARLGLSHLWAGMAGVATQGASLQGRQGRHGLSRHSSPLGPAWLRGARFAGNGKA